MTAVKRRHFRHSYAQEGEDLILAELFAGKRNGCFVDVGAHHPKRFSNTYHFYRFRNWRGVNIDAMPGSMRRFNKSRPEDVNVEAAIGDREQTLEYFVFNETALNTFDPKLAAERDGCNGYHIVRSVPVAITTLWRTLDQHLPADRAIDFLTIDVEGLDLAVLSSNNWDRYRPEVILVEDTTATNWKQIGSSPTTLFLQTHGYEPIANTPRTIFFRRM